VRAWVHAMQLQACDGVGGDDRKRRRLFTSPWVVAFSLRARPWSSPRSANGFTAPPPTCVDPRHPTPRRWCVSEGGAELVASRSEELVAGSAKEWVRRAPCWCCR
jgi:hypothetical protein